MTGLARAGWAAVVLLPLTACAIFHPVEPVPGPNEGAWAAERDRFTRGAKLYDVLDDRAFVTATYQATSVRQARVDRVAVWQSLTDDRRAALFQAENAEGEIHDDFLLAFFTADRTQNDLDARRSIWSISLVVPGRPDATAVRVEGVPIDATIRYLYPYIGDFDLVYRVHFARAAGAPPLEATPFVLRIAGAPGRIDLDFGR